MTIVLFPNLFAYRETSGVIVLHVLEEPLLGELSVEQGLCVGLDVSLLEVVGVGLITCEEVGSSRESISFQAKYAGLLRPTR